MTVYHIPENEQKIDELYVVLSSDHKGEGIVSFMSPMGGMPMVFGHKRMIDKVRESVKKMSRETGKKLIIYKFVKQEVLEEIQE